MAIISKERIGKEEVHESSVISEGQKRGTKGSLSSVPVIWPQIHHWGSQRVWLASSKEAVAELGRDTEYKLSIPATTHIPQEYWGPRNHIGIVCY